MDLESVKIPENYDFFFVSSLRDVNLYLAIVVAGAGPNGR